MRFFGLLAFVLVGSNILVSAAPTASFSKSFYSGKTTKNAQVAADFNDDGLDDLVTAESTSDSSGNVTSYGVYIYTNNNGSLASKTKTAIPGNVTSMAAAEFSGDGYLDLVTVAGSTVTVSVGNGYSAFTPVAHYTSAKYSGGRVVTGDFNNDGKQDFAVLSGYNLTILTNAGNNVFKASTMTVDASAPNAIPGLLAAGDFNGDGRMDLAYTTSECPDVCSYTLHTLKNTNTGWVDSQVLPSAPLGAPYVLKAIDVDGDGRSDLVLVNVPGEQDGDPTAVINVYYSDSGGSFTEKVFGLMNGVSIYDVLLADVNNDGYADLIAVTNANGTQLDNLFVYFGAGGRSFDYSSPDQAFSLGKGSSLAFVNAGFLNNDARKDLSVWAAPTISGASWGLFKLTNTGAVNTSCFYPTASGVNFCSATVGGSSVRVVAYGRAAVQPLARMELWIDGTKAFQVFADKMEVTEPLSSGTHRIVIHEVDALGHFSTAVKNVTVQ